MACLRILHSTGVLPAEVAAAPAVAPETSDQPTDQAAAQPAAPPAPTSAFTITGDAGVWSQYRFRGISQSDNKPVVQGAFTITHSSGFYISAWGSSAGANKAVDLGGTEINVDGSYSHAFAKNGVTLDGGLYGYLCPRSQHAVGISESYYEIYGHIAKTLDPVTAVAGVNFAPNQSYFSDNGRVTRHNGYVFGELGLTISTTAITIRRYGDHVVCGLYYVCKDYINYALRESYKWNVITLDLSAVGTNISKRDTHRFDQCLATIDFHHAAEPALVGSVSASF